MSTRRWMCAALALVALGGCTSISQSYMHSFDERTITGTARFGGFFGVKPSPDAVRVAAAEACPDGYDTISETWSVFEGAQFTMVIRCRRVESDGGEAKAPDAGY